MDPDNNNILAGSGTPGANDGTGASGLSATDSLLSATDGLASSDFSTGPTAGSAMGLDEIGSMKPEATMTPPVEEPLVPAAPVPGSIGSVTSVPPLDPADAMPPVPPTFAPADPTTATTTAAAATDSAMPAAPADAASAGQLPYNPFAAQMGQTMDTTPSSAPVAPSFEPDFSQPAQPSPAPTAPLKGKPQKLVLILGIAAGVFALSTIIFLALFIYQLNHPKVTYVKPEAGVSTSRVDTMNCSHDEDLAWLANVAHPVTGTQTLTLSYSDNLLKSLTNNYTATYDDIPSAELARDNLTNVQMELLSLVGNSFTSEYSANDGIMKATITSNDSMTQTDAATLIYGANGAYYSTSLDSVRSYLEGNGFVCETEE